MMRWTRIKGEIRPSADNLETAREIVLEALVEAEDMLPKDEEYGVSLGWTEQDFVIENMDGTHGRAHNASFFEVNFNTSAEEWKKAIKTTAVHEYAHTWYYEKRFDSEGRNNKIWQYVIDEALTQNFAEKLFPEHVPDHRVKHDKNKIAEYWPEIRDKELGKNTDEVSLPHVLYINKSDEGYPNWLGYSMSYLLGKELLNKHEFKDFPDITREQLVEAGNKLFEGE